MRLAIFHSTLPEPDRKPGGVELFVHRLAQELQAREHDVTVFTYSPIPSEARYRGVRLTPASWAGSRVARMTAVPVRLNRLPQDEFDLLHLHGDDWFFVRRSIPTVRTFYGSAFHEARYATRWRHRAKYAVVGPLEILASRLATASYGAIPDHARWLKQRGALPIGITIPREVPAAGMREAEPTVLFIGTWGGRKRGRDLHRIFTESVRPSVPTAQLWMVADHCEPAPGVVWHRRPSDAELEALLERAWVVCHPSLYEGFGIPYLEAMAHGVPVVASPNPGAGHVIGDSGAGLVTPDGELGATLVRVLQDSELRDQMAQAGRERARAFAWDEVIDAHEKAYMAARAAWAARR